MTSPFSFTFPATFGYGEKENKTMNNNNNRYTVARQYSDAKKNRHPFSPSFFLTFDTCPSSKLCYPAHVDAVSGPPQLPVSA